LVSDTLTNYHVVKGCSEISISGPVPEISVAMLASDPPADLALLHPAGNLSGSPLRFREGAGPRAGDGVVAIGFPLQGLLAFEPNVTTGTISALAGMKNDDRYVQITAPVQPGNSGGPLLDMSGNVVGVVSAKLDALKLASIRGDVPENVNFAVKYLIVRNFLDTHAVHYETAASTAEISAAAIADRARKSTVFVSCR
jgi:S1-C subfamily serine protease